MSARKRGRPAFKWHGPPGLEFVRAVDLTWWQRSAKSNLTSQQKSTSSAINVVVRVRHDFPDLEKHSDQYLRKQYLNAKEFWSPCGPKFGMANEWYMPLAEPVRIRSRHPALDNFNRNAAWFGI